MADRDRSETNQGEPRAPRGWAPHPRERMLMTPLVAGLGGLLAFFAVVFVVVWLPIHTFDPPPSADWAPLSKDALKGRDLFASNGCYVCHSGYSRPQDVRYALYFLYPKVSQPGDFYGSDHSPNLFGTERTGPDLSQDAGWHPNDWHRAHFYNPRFIDPLSLMPPMKAIFSDKQVDEVTLFTQGRSGKSGLLRYAGQIYAKHVVNTVQGFPPPYRGFQGAHKPPLKPKEVEPPPNQLEEAPNLAQIDRSYWLAGNPLPVTEQNLLRGKEVFLERCVGCHGPTGNGKGPAGRFLSPTPLPFDDADDQCCGGDTGPGDFYFRVLRGWSGTGRQDRRQRPGDAARPRTRRGRHQDDLRGPAQPGLGRREGARREAAARVPEEHPADRPGAAMRRFLAALALTATAALAMPAAALAHDAPENDRSKWVMTDWPLDIDEEDYYTPEWALDEEEWDDVDTVR